METTSGLAPRKLHRARRTPSPPASFRSPLHVGLDLQAIQHAGTDQAVHRRGPMAVSALLVRRHLAESLPGLGHQEDWVIPKALRAARLWDQLAAALAFEQLSR